MINISEVTETNEMIQHENLDVRTITMGISLFDCIDSSLDACTKKIYDKICKKAGKLVETGEHISQSFGIPVVNKRISVTPIATVGSSACNTEEDYIKIAETLDKAAANVGVNLIGGYSAMLAKGNTDKEMIFLNSIPEALKVTSRVCSSVNVGSPIGICLNYYEQNNNFIVVKINGVDIKLYDNGKLNVMDAVLSIGMGNADIFPKKGKDLTFTVNGNTKTVKGHNGESAFIMVNGEEAGVITPVKCNDIINVKESTVGEDGHMKAGGLDEYKKGIFFIINGKQVRFERKTSADILEQLKIEDPVVEKILNYRQLTKLKSTYADGLNEYIDEDGRIRMKKHQP